MSCDRTIISKKLRMYKELSYLGGVIEEGMANELKRVLPPGFPLAELSNVPGPELYNSIDYVDNERNKITNYFSAYGQYYGDEDGLNEWFAKESLKFRKDSKIRKLASQIAETGVVVSTVEAGIIYYMFGMDGKGERGPEEIAHVSRFKPGSKYACRLAEWILADEELYEQLIFFKEEMNG